MKRISFATALLVVYFALSAYCQPNNSVINRAVSGLRTLSGNHIIEKAYLHFDKPYYAVGDTVYFKAYVLLGEHDNLSEVSNILHVDLISPGNSIISSIQLQLINGIGWGVFAIPFSFDAGNYRIRAYTRYMQNAPDYFFDKTIPIGSVMKSAVAKNDGAGARSVKPDLQFFPEGGDLVNFMSSKIAFKAIGANGMGMNVKGRIVDNSGTPVASFASGHLGMGAFYLMPEEGKTYQARVTFANGSQDTFDLPAARHSGILLAVKDTLDKMSIDISSSKAYFQENLNKDINVVIYGSGFVKTINARLDSRRLSVDIPNGQFPSGVVRITLFSQNGEPLSERLVFVKNPDLVELTLKGNKDSYSKRDRVSFTLNAKTRGTEAEGHFSVAVIDERKVPFDENNETTILSYLLLSSALRGYIEQPNYYFRNTSTQAAADLDVLMLTQGYRRFTWQQLLNDQETAFTYPPEKTLEITGTAKTAAGAPVVNMDIMLLSSDKSSMLGDRTDNAGKFRFTNLPAFADSVLLTLQATGSSRSKNETLLTVDINKQGPPIAVDKQPVSQENDVNASMVSYLRNSQAQRDAVYTIGARPSNGAAHADEMLTGVDINNSGSLTKALSGLRDVNMVEGVPYLKGRTDKDPMLVVINGKIRGSYVNLDNLTAADIEKVEVLKGSNADSYGVYGSSGVLSITSRTGKDVSNSQNVTYKYHAQNVVKVKNASYVESDKTNYRSSNLGGSGHADQVVSGDEIKTSPSLSAGLNGRLRGVYFVNGTPYLNNNLVFNGTNQVAEPMYVVLDGYEITGGIDNINPLSIETVELLKGPSTSVYGMNGGAGVLVLTSRQGVQGVSASTSSLGSLQFRAKGFLVARQFYSPKYENKTNSTAVHDLRSTIYWNPELVTNKDGNAYFEFYNADGQGTYRVVVEGIDNNGNIGRQVYQYKVE